MAHLPIVYRQRWDYDESVRRLKPTADAAPDVGTYDEVMTPLSADWSAGDIASAHGHALKRVVDVLVVVLSAAGGYGVLASLRHGPQGTLLLLDLGVGLSCSVALLWRQHFPVELAVVITALSAFFATAGVANVIALFAVAVRRRLGLALAVGAFNMAAGLGFYLAYPKNASLAVTAAVVVSICLATVAWGALVQARRQLLMTLRDRAERAESEQRARADQARRAERELIAREMHDVVAHRVSLVALHAGGLQVRPDLPPDQIVAIAELIRHSAQDALDELRAVVGVLRADESQIEAPPPQLTDIADLVAEFVRAGAKVDLEMNVASPESAPGALGRDAYRIVREALTNSDKHSSGSSVQVRVEGAAGGGLKVSIRNQLHSPSCGPTLQGAGVGLLGLTERVSLSGGTLTHGPTPDGEFLVEARLRWQS